MKTTAGGVMDYCGNFIYSDNQLITIFAGEVRVAPVNVGNSTYWKYEYSMKDHLGNVRVVFAAHSHGQPELLQQTSYYPFGMTMQQQNFSSQNATENKYLYNSKELQDDQLAGNTLDWYDYGARFYDATLGRWHVVDPLAEKYYSISTYAYVANNPMIFIDPDGMRIDGYTINEKGEINRVNNTGGKEYDVLYTKKDYDQARTESKETGSKNEYGNPEPGNSVRVTSGTFSESNMITIGDIKGVKTSNEADAKAIYKFAANSFSVEFGLVIGGDKNGTQSIIHTSGSFEYTRTGEVANSMINEGFLILETNHSHPGNYPGGSTPSGFYSNGTPIKPLEGDAKSADYIDKKNGTPAIHLMYHPQSGKTYQYNSKRYVEKK